MNADLERVKKTGEVITMDVPVSDITGNDLWYQSTIVPVYHASGTMDCIMVYNPPDN